MEGFDIKQHRKWIALGLLAVIIIMSLYVYKHKDDLFMNRITVEYPDGCIEIFENAELVTPVCEEGRIMEQAQADGRGKWETIPTINFSLGLNLTE